MTDQAEKKHSAFWGVMVIAGTVIGGGMFALPVDLAGAWFFWGAFILIIAWFSILWRKELCPNRKHLGVTGSFIGFRLQ